MSHTSYRVLFYPLGKNESALSIIQLSGHSLPFSESEIRVRIPANSSSSLRIVPQISAVSSLKVLMGIIDERFPFEDCFLLGFFFVSIMGISTDGVEMSELEF